MTSREELTGFVDALELPRIPSGGLVVVMDMGKAAIKGSILSLASDDGAEQPDLISWMEDRKLLSDDGRDETVGESVLVDNYKDREDEVDTKKREIDNQARQVKDSAFEAFNLSNTTFQAIHDRVGELRDALESIDDNTNDKGQLVSLTPAADTRAQNSILQAVDDVHDKVESAFNEFKNQERRIDDSRPQVSNASYGGGTPSGGDPGSSAGGSSAASQASTASYDPATKGTREGIVGIANDELGVMEIADNVVDRPYNINNEWCASFASYAWEKAGYDTDWMSNRNKVSTIWDEANANGLATTDLSEVKPGDMIIFNWDGGEEDHVGIVESVDGGKITTIEGNTSAGGGGEGVYRKEYNAHSSEVVGFVQPPGEQQGVKRPPIEV